MKTQSKYAVDSESEKLVQIKMMDVVYNNKMCTLVYLVDISKSIYDENNNES